MILIFDHGTSAIKTCVLNSEGRFLARSSAPIHTQYPKSGWVEQDPSELWMLTLQTAESALKKAGIAWDEIRGIGITNQRETTILWDAESGQPIHPAVVWQCRRTQEICDGLKEYEPLIRERTGLVLDPYFSGTKIRWIMNQVPQARELLSQGKLRFGTVDSWIAWNLTSGAAHITDRTNASRTMLFNIHKQAWDPDLAELLGVPLEILPQVVGSAEINTVTDPKWTGGHEIPISAIAGDQQAALYGQRCWEPGAAKSTYGTGTFLMLNIGEEDIRSDAGLLTTVGCGANGEPKYALEGAVFVAGAAVDWLVSGLGVAPNPADLDQLASQVPSSEGVAFVPAFVGLGAPHWDPNARGMICGLTQSSTAGHLARATFEALAYQTREVLALMQQEAGLDLAELRVDGGVTRSALFSQILADVLALPVVRVDDPDLTAKGVGYLAGLAAGMWKNPDEIRQLEQKEERFEPRSSEDERERGYAQWLDAVQRARFQSTS